MFEDYLSHISQLNAAFGVEEQLVFFDRAGGVPCVSIRNQSATALISLYGGQVLSYKPHAEDKDLLFLSESAYFDATRPIRGGIPICWPWFGPDPECLKRPNHGFVRTALWTVVQAVAQSADRTRITLSYKTDDSAVDLWPHQCALTLDIDVGEKLTVMLTTCNSGSKPFYLTQALHTYFSVEDVEHTQLLGLNGRPYVDHLTSDPQQTDRQAAVEIHQETERVYYGQDIAMILDDRLSKRRIHIEPVGSSSVVVWNPWIAKSRGMGDLDDGAYRRFVCVETGHVAPQGLELSPGQQIQLQTTFFSR